MSKALIIAPQAVIRLGLSCILGKLWPNSDVIEASSVKDALDAVEGSGSPDLIILEPGAEHPNWASAVALLRSAHPDAALLLFVDGATRRAIIGSIEAGAAGVISRSGSLEEIMSGLRIVKEGGYFIPKTFSVPQGSERDDDGAGDSPQQEPSLTPRQKQVLALLAEGLSNQEIADQLGMSAFTARVHVSAVLKALGVSNRTKAALFAATQTYRLANSAENEKDRSVKSKVSN